jgi:hypothetical protein
VDGNLAGKRYE